MSYEKLMNFTTQKTVCKKLDSEGGMPRIRQLFEHYKNVTA